MNVPTIWAPLQVAENCVVVDTGATRHIFNDPSLFDTLRSPPAAIQIEGVGGREYGYAFRVRTGVDTVFGIYEPGSYEDATTCPDAEKWVESMKKEWVGLTSRGCLAPN